MTEHVPTVAELAHRGLARIITPPKGSASGVYRVTDEGHAVMGEALRANGREARDD